MQKALQALEDENVIKGASRLSAPHSSLRRRDVRRRTDGAAPGVDNRGDHGRISAPGWRQCR
jgi:hypothetical protein